MKIGRIFPIIKWGCLAPIATILILISFIIILDALIPSAARQALPPSASDIQEYYSDSWNGDFVRVLKAKLPKKDYPTYAEKLGLKIQYDQEKNQEIRSILNMSISDAPDWWTPPPTTATSYYDHVKGDEYLEVLSYADGTVYYLVVAW